MLDKPYIVQISRDVVDTGGGRVVIETSQCMADAGYNVVIITDTKCDFEYEGIEFRYTYFGLPLKSWNAKYKLTKTLRHFLQLFVFTFSSWLENKKIKKQKIVLNHNLESVSGDIYVLHNVFNFENAQKQPLKKIVRWLNPVFFFRGFREYYLLSRAKNKLIIAVSNKTLLEATPYCNKKTRIISINNGVNADYFKYLPRTTLPEMFTIVFVGHEFERKGLDALILSLKYLPENIVVNVVGGGGSSIEKYQRITNELGVSDRVHFLNTLLGHDLVLQYHNADLFVLPSKYETWALVGLESMSCGLPALMTNVGGISEYLEDGYNGYFIETDAMDIAEKINKVVRNPEHYLMLSKNARSTAIEHSWRTCAGKYIEEIRVISDYKYGENKDLSSSNNR